MKFYKVTPDGTFTLSIESQLMDTLAEDGMIPTSSLEQLILELELITFTLKESIEGDEDASPSN